MVVSNPRKDASQISVCVFVQSDSSWQGGLDELLLPGQYSLNIAKTPDTLIEDCSEPVDCLIIEDPHQSQAVFSALEKHSILLPTVLLCADPALNPAAEQFPQPTEGSQFFYHPAEIKLECSRMRDKLPHCICQAIANFMRLSAIARADKRESFQAWFSDPPLQEKLRQQQVRLSQKLKERLGYLGVYYKRDRQQFLRYLDPEERKGLAQELKEDYRQIILSYFQDDQNVNTMLDSFVTKAFFADISVTWLLEMHMNLMDNFAKQLKLEGRSDEVLLDYRLTLIDAIAHLSEMYRLSVPQES